MKKGKVITMRKQHNLKVTEAGPVHIESTELYHEILKRNPLNEKAYTRLMVLYRKGKEFKKELQIIETALKVFEPIYHLKARSKDNKIIRVSKQLNLAFGLVDKKGISLYEPEPIAGWKKRRITVLNKLRLKK
ncbi:MAG: hypothetical protein ABIO04_12605 [Ferruginibacter sp.]